MGRGDCCQRTNDTPWDDVKESWPQLSVGRIDFAFDFDFALAFFPNKKGNNFCWAFVNFLFSQRSAYVYVCMCMCMWQLPTATFNKH